MDYPESKSIKNWATEDRPREKLLEKGVNSLTNSELLAILIRSGTLKESAIDIAKKIMSLANNNLNNLGKLTVKDFTTIKGVGPTKAITLISALELGRRRKSETTEQRQLIQGSQTVFNIFSPILSDIPHEEFWVLFLNRANKVIDRNRISMGAVSGTIVDVRIILKMAVERLCSAIILCHNHPSGNLTPSEADKKLTTKIKSACVYFDITLLDHIIIGDNQYYSFADNGIL
ncbi:MAG: DNA repair protein RadC [Bacteroidales bacterium]|nr:DNA repair protein RadC [Bacteroidales bacterium]